MDVIAQVSRSSCLLEVTAWLRQDSHRLQVNEFVKRVRACKIHTLLVGHLRKQMPALMGKQKAQEKMLRDLGKEFSLVQREHHLPAGEPESINRCKIPSAEACEAGGTAWQARALRLAARVA